MIRSALCIALSAALLSACATRPLRYARAEAPAVPASERETTLLAIARGSFGADGRCIDPTAEAGGGFAAVLSPIIGIVVDTLLGAVTDGLARLQEGRNATWTASTTPVGLAAGNSYCLTAARGVIAGAAGDGSPQWSGTPVFELKANLAVIATNDPAASVADIRPVFLSYAETSAPRRGSGMKDVIVAITLSPIVAEKPAKAEAGGAETKPEKKAEAGGAETKPEKKAEAPKPPGAIVLNFGRLEAGRSYGRALLGPVSGAAALPASALYSAGAVVTETEAPSAALKALAAAYGANKDGLSKALKDAIADAVGADAK
jgi:hypothetical protein